MATVQKDKVKNLQKADNGGKFHKILPKISDVLPGEELVLKLAPGNPDTPVPPAHCGLEGGPPGNKVNFKQFVGYKLKNHKIFNGWLTKMVMTDFPGISHSSEGKINY